MIVELIDSIDNFRVTIIDMGAVKWIINMLKSQRYNTCRSTVYLLSRMMEYGVMHNPCLIIMLIDAMQRTYRLP